MQQLFGLQAGLRQPRMQRRLPVMLLQFGLRLRLELRMQFRLRLRIYTREPQGLTEQPAQRALPELREQQVPQVRLLLQSERLQPVIPAAMPR